MELDEQETMDMPTDEELPIGWNSSDEDILNSLNRTRQTLDGFRALHSSFINSPVFDMIKREAEKFGFRMEVSENEPTGFSGDAFLHRNLVEHAPREDERDPHYHHQPPSIPAAPRNIVDVNPDDLIVDPPHLICKFERKHYYHGTAPDPPELYYRSDLETNPYPLPPPGTTQVRLPIKSAGGIPEAFRRVKEIVIPLILKLCDERGINWSLLLTAQFTTHYEDGRETLGPLVIWTGTDPGSTTPAMARDVSPDILRILEDHGVFGAVVEWYDNE